MTEQLVMKEQEPESELLFLNRNHSFPLEGWEGSELPASAWQRFKFGIRNRLRRFILGSVLGDYLQREQEYQAHLVRLLNHWKSLYDTEVHGLRHSLAGHEQRLKTAESVIRGIERIIASAGKSVAQSADGAADVPPVFGKDYSYLLLENRFRGSEEEIQKRLSPYAAVLKDVPGPVLEVGSGRGELLRLLQQAGVPAYGVELDPAMVERGKAAGVDVRLENGLSHLEASPRASFGAVVAIQVLEHLPYQTLQQFLRLCREKIRPGGLVIAETIDTSSLVALSQNYFRDPTHAAPLHPETLSYLFELSGLEVIEVRKLSAYPEGFELQKFPVIERSTAELSAVSGIHNENIDKLNQLLYGYQDYCVIARVP